MTKRKLITKKQFNKRLLKSILLASGLLFFSLFIGVVGYMHYYQLNWIDALLNASMILTGMGPVTVAQTNGAKIFASFYALYSGIAFLTSVAVIFAPVLHRFLHKFHLDLDDDD
jgi:NhaP-type Na+/H+ or K+/H+ antiporter